MQSYLAAAYHSTKHKIEKHNGQIQEYTCRLVTKERGLLHLSLREAILIQGQVQGTSMNDRLERGRGTGIVRVNMGQGIT